MIANRVAYFDKGNIAALKPYFDNLLLRKTASTTDINRLNKIMRNVYTYYIVQPKMIIAGLRNVMQAAAKANEFGSAIPGLSTITAMKTMYETVKSIRTAYKYLKGQEFDLGWDKKSEETLKGILKRFGLAEDIFFNESYNKADKLDKPFALFRNMATVWTDVVSRIGLYNQLSKQIDKVLPKNGEPVNIDKVYHALKISNFSPTKQQIILNDLINGNIDKFKQEYLTEKIIQILYSYQASDKALYFQSNKMFGFLLTYPIQTLTKTIQQISNIKNAPTIRAKLENASSTFNQVAGGMAGTVAMSLVAGLAMSLSAGGDDSDEEKELKKEIIKTVMHYSVLALSTTQQTNALINTLTGTDYSNYGSDEFLSLATSSPFVFNMINLGKEIADSLKKGDFASTAKKALDQVPQMAYPRVTATVSFTLNNILGSIDKTENKSLYDNVERAMMTYSGIVSKKLKDEGYDLTGLPESYQKAMGYYYWEKEVKGQTPRDKYILNPKRVINDLISSPVFVKQETFNKEVVRFATLQYMKEQLDPGSTAYKVADEMLKAQAKVIAYHYTNIPLTGKQYLKDSKEQMREKIASSLKNIDINPDYITNKIGGE